MDVDETDARKPKDEIEGDWSAEVYFTNPNYQAKKFNFLLFINREELLFLSRVHREANMRSRSLGRVT